MDRLPYEILREITLHVILPPQELDYDIRQLLSTGPPHSQVADLKKLRLINQGFASAAAEHMFSEVLLVLNTASIERLRSISQHPTFSKHVKALRYEPNIRYRFPETAPWEESSFRITALCDHRFHSTEQVKECKKHHDTSEIAKAMERFPNLEELIINKSTDDTGCRESVNLDEIQKSLKGVSSAGIKLKHFECHLFDWDKPIFKLTELKYIENTFSNLRSLRLTMRSNVPDEINQGPGAKSLSELLSFATNLRSLALRNSDPKLGYEDELGKIVGNQESPHLWPLLHELVLDGFNTSEEMLMRLLEQHSKTLRVLSLGLMVLEEGKWHSVLWRIRNNLQLSEFYSSCSWNEVWADLNFWWVNCFEHNDPRQHERDIIKSESYDLAMAIREYILHGGDFDIRKWQKTNLLLLC